LEGGREKGEGRKEKGERRREEGEGRKEKGERRKEEGGRRKEERGVFWRRAFTLAVASHCVVATRTETRTPNANKPMN